MADATHTAQDLCFQCNRPSRPHCPQCGSLRRYGFVNKVDRVTRPDGSTVSLRVYRCLTCANVYNDDDWQLRCAAPVATSVGRPAAVSPRNDVVNPQVPQWDMNDAEAALAKIKKARGLA